VKTGATRSAGQSLFPQRGRWPQPNVRASSVAARLKGGSGEWRAAPGARASRPPRSAGSTGLFSCQRWARRLGAAALMGYTLYYGIMPIRNRIPRLSRGPGPHGAARIENKTNRVQKS